MNKKLPLIILLLLLARITLLVWSLWPEAPKSNIRQVPFTQLPGWETANPLKSLQAFQRSCKTFLRQDPQKEAGSPPVSLQVGDWHPVCEAAMTLPELTRDSARQFFESWFTPVEISSEGLFTGYYSPIFEGCLKRTASCTVPLYGRPKDLITAELSEFDPGLSGKRIAGRLVNNKLVPYFTRKDIDEGALEDRAPVIAWLKSPLDRLFLEIQGSGMVQIEDGSLVYVGYEAQNGAPYTAIAKVLIDKGVMTRDNASMQHIRRYLAENPAEMNPTLHQNRSFVFFRTQNQTDAFGSQGVALTPGYSLAVDRQWIPMGTPLWLETTHPDTTGDTQKPFRRLMIAQDTGGAIRGMVRGDVYWGSGERATAIAGRMKNPGHYWMLLPHDVVKRLPDRLPG